MRIKVVDFVKKLEEIGYDNETLLEFDTLDGTTGDAYKLELTDYVYGDEYSVPNENVINVEFMVDDDFVKVKAGEFVSELAKEIRGVLNKYR